MAGTTEMTSIIQDMRPHQRFVVELALKQNTIACLPTGSGKTLIAVELTKCYLNEAIKKGKKIIFLTSTVPLAKQQAEYFRAHLSNTASGIEAQHVDCLTGDRNVRYWTGETGRKIWNQILSDFEVLVMTSQIFLDAINHTFIGFEKVILLIMDECHHAIKDDAMNKIMERYMESRERFLQDETCRVGFQIPRILGLTASIINGKNKLGSVEMEVKAAEERLCSKAVTYHSYEEMLKYSTNAKMEYMTYTENNFWGEEIPQCLVELKDMISTTSESLKRFENGHADKIQHPSLQSDNQLYGHRFSELKTLISLLDDVLGVYEDLGPYCARLAAIQKRAILTTILIDNFKNQTVQMMYYSVDPQLLIFISMIDSLMSDHDESNQIQVFITEKLKKLLGILSGYAKQPSDPVAGIVKENVGKNVPSVNDNELCGIVFVKKRATAQILNVYLQDVCRLGLIRFVKSCCVVGTSNYDSIEAPISAKIQASTLQSFRNKTHNLLVATNVVEEGLDVPACNLVVRFDKIESYPSYIQSMGRARSDNSKFYAILNKSEERNQIDEYEKFKEFNIELSEVLRRNAIHADEDVEEFGVDGDTSDESLIPPFQPVRDGPRITANDAISIVYRYCQTLPCDKLSLLTPISWWKQVKAGYQAFVQLPSNSVIRREIEGEVYGSKTLAKRSAFMNTCKLLYEENVFDDNLYPIARKSTSVIDSFLEGLPAETDSQGRKVGSTKRTQRYKKMIPLNSEYADIIPGLKCNAYELAIELMSTPSPNDEITTSLYQFSKRQFGYCLITTADLSIIPQFILNVGTTVGCLKVTLKQYDDGIMLSAEEIGKLLEFERYLFGDILELKNEILQQAKSTSFLFSPIPKTNENTKATHLSVHWELVERLLGIPKDFFNPPSKEKRKNFAACPQLYEDAVVIPWHREDIFFYTVMDVLEGTTPRSTFEDGKQGYKNYESYYLIKYSHINFISDPTQPLLKAKTISSNLNFFKKSAAFKRSLEERKDESGAVVKLIPELTNLHPMPASLFIQCKFLPSILQRINRFLSARQIQKLVAAGTSWETQEASMKVDMEEELLNLFDEEPPNKKQLLQAGCSTNTVTAPLGTGSGSGTRDESAASFLSVKHPSQLQLKSGQSTEIADDIASLCSLANMHPNQIKSSHIRQVKNLDSLRRRQRKESKLISAGSRRHSPNNVEYLKWNYAKETLYCKELAEFSVIEELLKTTKKLDRAKEDSSTQPSLYTIMQAITTEGSLDSVSLERLETIGDSFLKYCVCRHVFSHFPGFNEGDMTRYKSEFVSNAFLYAYGKKFQLGGYLGAGIFQPRLAWLPPSFTMPTLLAEVAADNDVNEDIFNKENISELVKLSRSDLDKFVREKSKRKDKVVVKMPANVGYDYARVTDKSIADSVEALIGAYFLAAGSIGALRFMEKLGLRGPCLKEVGSTEVTSEIFGNWPVPTTVYEPGQDCVENHLPFYKELEQLIGYKFNEPWILVEAFSHPSYVRNRVTGCYQRLEFLGDAVLDFLITTHIFKESQKMKPGQLTDLRSALVNNVTFGSLAVRYGLHLYLRHGSEKNLQERIDDFVQRQRDVGHNVEGHFKLLSDFDTPCVEDIEVPKVLGDLFESLAGAVFVDSGMSLDTVWKIFYRLMKNEIDEFSIKLPKSPVRELYERFPGRKIFKEWTAPEASAKAMSNRKPGFSYVTLTMPYFGLDGGIKSHDFIGMGKSKQSAKVGLAKYINYLEAKKSKNRS